MIEHHNLQHLNRSVQFIPDLDESEWNFWTDSTKTRRSGELRCRRGRSLRGEDESCVEDDFSGAIRTATGVIFGARLLGRLIS